MGSQENTEKALRQLHMLISKADTMPDNLNKAIIDKRQAEVILNELNRCIYEMFEEYEVTRESKERSELAIRREGERMTKEAQKRAEDVYAASIMYSDDALTKVVNIMQQASQSVERVYQEMLERIHEQEKTVRNNQSELRSQLHTMQDTEKYLQMIRDQRAAEEREERLQKGIERRPINIYANRRSEVKVNKAALQKMGIKPVVEDMDSLLEDIPDREDVADEPVKTAATESEKPAVKAEQPAKAAEASPEDSAKNVVKEAKPAKTGTEDSPKEASKENAAKAEQPAKAAEVKADKVEATKVEAAKEGAAKEGAASVKASAKKQEKTVKEVAKPAENKTTRTVKKVVKKVVKKPVIKDNFADLEDDEDLVTINLKDYDI